MGELKTRCPVCGDTLMVGSDGQLVCPYVECPDPLYAYKILRSECERLGGLKQAEGRAKLLRSRAPLGHEPGEPVDA